MQELQNAAPLDHFLPLFPLFPPQHRSLPNIREQIIVPAKPTGRLACARVRRTRSRRRSRRRAAPTPEIVVAAPPRALRGDMRCRRRWSGRLAGRAR